MYRLLATTALLGLATVALADEPAPVTPTDDSAQGTAPDDQLAPAPDCAGLEGDELKTCEAAGAAATQEAAPEEQKGGKAMQKSNDNRMEAFDDDE